jgi:hypothetical protein
MNRLPDWPQRLNSYVEGLRSVPFAWGTADCCQFIAGAVLAITDEDHRALFGAYDSEEGAQTILDQFGGLEELLTHALGVPIHVSQMGRGDVCITDHDGAARVCLGTHLVSFGSDGLNFVKRNRAGIAWRVG